MNHQDRFYHDGAHASFNGFYLKSELSFMQKTLLSFSFKLFPRSISCQICFLISMQCNIATHGDHQNRHLYSWN